MHSSLSDPTSANHFGFLTLSGFSMIALTNAIEPLRMANCLAECELYRWSVYSVNGTPAAASNGLTLTPTKRIDESAVPDILFVCGGANVTRAVDRELVQLLCGLAQRRIVLGALCTGAYALARAGLLDGYRCAIHWENIWGSRENFPRIMFTPNLFVVDRDRYTCTGGVAPLDFMIHLITPRIGRALAAGISEAFIIDRVRESTDHQYIPLAARLGGSYPSVTLAAQLMEANIEEPLSIGELAQLCETSQRQLQRLFRSNLNLTPEQYYVTVRLGRARKLLQQTSMSVIDIGVACGFGSPCHFSRSYRALFGHAPSWERRPHRTKLTHMPDGLPLAGSVHR